MNSISAIIIAKNEEKMIDGALRSVSFCDEVIVVDNGSSDQTVTIAKKLKAIVYEYISSDFSKSRNFGLEKAKSEWVLYIDADERVSKELMIHIKALLANPQAKAAYRIKRKNYYFFKYQWPTIEILERLFQKKQLVSWYGRLHESPKVEGKIGEIDGFLLHYTHRTLSGMLDKTLEWSTVEAESRLLANHPNMTWWRFPRVMISAFYASYITQHGWKVGTPGLIESIYQGFSAFVTYAKLWEMQEKLKSQNAKGKTTT